MQGERQPARVCERDKKKEIELRFFNYECVASFISSFPFPFLFCSRSRSRSFSPSPIHVFATAGGGPSLKPTAGLRSQDSAYPISFALNAAGPESALHKWSYVRREMEMETEMEIHRDEIGGRIGHEIDWK